MTPPKHPRLKNFAFKCRRMVFKKDENAYTPFMSIIIISSILAVTTTILGLTPLRTALEGPEAQVVLWATASLFTLISLYSARRWWFIQPTTESRRF